MFRETSQQAMPFKSFFYFSIFQAFLCVIFILLTSLLLHFFSDSYKKFKCEEHIKELINSESDIIKNKVLNHFRSKIFPLEDISDKSKDDYFSIEMTGKLIDLGFKEYFDNQLDDKHNDNEKKYPSYFYRYRIDYDYKGLGTCVQLNDKKENHSSFSITSLPLNGWVIYNSLKEPLKFDGTYNNRIRGRVFSEGDVVFNHRLEGTGKEFKLKLGDKEKNAFTFFTNCNDEMKIVPFGLGTRENVKVLNYKYGNNLVYFKEFNPCIKFESPYDVNPIRLVSDIYVNMHSFDYEKVLQVNIPDKNESSRAIDSDYFSILKDLTQYIGKNAPKKVTEHFKYVNYIYLNYSKNELKYDHYTEMTNLEKGYLPIGLFSSISSGNKVTINMEKFYVWYRQKYTMRIPLAENALYNTRQLIIYIDSSSRNIFEYNFEQLDQIPIRTLLIAKGHAIVTSPVNENEMPFAIMANDFSFVPNETVTNNILNGVFIKARNYENVNDFISFEGMKPKNSKLLGSMIYYNAFKNIIISETNSSNYVDEKYPDVENIKIFNFDWDMKYLDPSTYLDFLPAKYFITE